MGEMAEKALLLTVEERLRISKVEAELLCEGGSLPAEARRVRREYALTVAFLLGYISVALLANAYLARAEEGALGAAYYMAGVFASLLGAFGLLSENAPAVLLYGIYAGAAFTTSAVVSSGTVSFLLRSDVCAVTGAALGRPEVEAFCRASPVRFQAIALAVVFGELILEALVVYRVKRIHDLLLDRRGGRVFLP